jgi:hypothetical protein
MGLCDTDKPKFLQVGLAQLIDAHAEDSTVLAWVRLGLLRDLLLAWKGLLHSARSLRIVPPLPVGT